MQTHTPSLAVDWAAKRLLPEAKTLLVGVPCQNQRLLIKRQSVELLVGLFDGRPLQPPLPPYDLRQRSYFNPAGSNIMYLTTPRLPLRVLLQKYHKAKTLTRRQAQASAVCAVYGWVHNVEHMDNNESLN